MTPEQLRQLQEQVETSNQLHLECQNSRIEHELRTDAESKTTAAKVALMVPDLFGGVHWVALQAVGEAISAKARLNNFLAAKSRG